MRVSLSLSLFSSVAKHECVCVCVSEIFLHDCGESVRLSGPRCASCFRLTGAGQPPARKRPKNGKTPLQWENPAPTPENGQQKETKQGGEVLRNAFWGGGGGEFPPISGDFRTGGFPAL